VSIVGPGNLGTALALALPTAGYAVKFIVTRARGGGRKETRSLARASKARLVELGKQRLDTEIIWMTVADDAIAATARRLANKQEWKGKIVFHSSGALTSDELTALRERGAKVASVHPMMTFVRGSVPEFTGVAFAVEGDPSAVRVASEIIDRLGGSTFFIRKPNKVLYHAFGSFASPLVVALMASLEQVAKAAGISPGDAKTMAVPLLQQTLRNYLKHDAASAFSGPLVRGDVATVRKHLTELKRVPEAREVYVALAKVALKSLPVKKRNAVERELRN
jgi:predicted short-subunit dehydrogenase-like oxidoreductase (DUF2520 family)